MELKNGDFCWVWFAEENEIMWGVVVDNRIVFQNGGYSLCGFFNESGVCDVNDEIVGVVGGIVRGAKSILEARKYYESPATSFNVIYNDDYKVHLLYNRFHKTPLKLNISDIELALGREVYITK